MSSGTSHIAKTALLSLAAALAALLATVACAPVADNMLTRVENNVARDQMMLVRSVPPTFGYQRLITQMRAYPDFATFVDQRGVPDFLAETGDRDRRYMILYYLADRQAFASRTVSPRSRTLEFAGPYPITDREFNTLDAIRKRSAEARAAENPR